MRTITKSNPERDFSSIMSKSKKVCGSFASFSSEKEHFTRGMYMTALICPSDVKIEPIMFYENINAKVFRRKIAFAIAVIVTSHSSSFKYSISIHAVHAGAERNVCNIVVSTETPQTTTNPSQTLLPMYKLAHLPCPTPSPHLQDPHNL